MTMAIDDAKVPDMLTDLLALSHCVRWSMIPVLKSQSVADHTFRVMVIASELVVRLGLGEEFAGAVLHWAMIHDGDEARTGDIMSSFKRIIEEVDTENMTPEASDFDIARERACPWYTQVRTAIHSHQFGPLIFGLVKLADRIEATTWLQCWGHGLHAKYVHGKMSELINEEADRLADVLVKSRDGIEAVDDIAAARINIGAGRYQAMRMLVGRIIDEIQSESGRRTDPK